MFFFTKRQRQALIPGPRSGDLLSANAESVNTSRSGPQPPHEHYPELRPRQANPLTTDVSTCGFLNGNGTLSRTAEPGFDCRVDTKNAIWGFCPTTVISASDCGLAGGCVDAHGCQLGCGISDDSSVTTFTCSKSGAEYCSIALSINGPDQTYSYLACASAARTDTYFNTPTATSSQPSTSSTSALSGAKPSITSAPSTSPATSSSPTSTSSSAISLALSSSSPLSTATPIPSNNTGAIVGGVLGGLALLAFLIVASLFYRKLKTRHADKAQGDDPPWQNEFQQGKLTKAPKEVPNPVELPSDGPTAELSGGRHGETTEMPNNIGKSRDTLET